MHKAEEIAEDAAEIAEAAAEIASDITEEVAEVAPSNNETPHVVSLEEEIRNLCQRVALLEERGLSTQGEIAEAQMSADIAQITAENAEETASRAAELSVAALEGAASPPEPEVQVEEVTPDPPKEEKSDQKTSPKSRGFLGLR